jgi:hypothetical protein
MTMSNSPSTTNLVTPFLTGGLKSVKFFNGRLLSGEDLTTEQQANLAERERLGLAIGDGVVRGLEVAMTSGATSPTVTVQPGLAINRNGDAVSLATAVDVALYQPTSNGTSPTGGTNGTPSPFAQCGPSAPGGFISGAGLFLLTVSPAAQTQGRAPVNGLGDGTDTCNAKYFVEGASFRLIQLPLTLDLTDSKLRNQVAGQCFGFDPSVDPMLNPFGTSQTKRGVIEQLRASTLTDAEVPLAVVSWTSGTGIDFVDMWSVRRRVASADAADDSGLPIGSREIARGEAIFLQFQDQVSAILTPTSAVATQLFGYLPAAGLLPLYSPAFPAGFVQTQFFQGLTVNGPITIDGARAQALLRESLRYPPVDLTTGEMFWVFTTWQNVQAAKAGNAQPFLIFASGQMPYFGQSRYDVARFDRSAWSQ